MSRKRTTRGPRRWLRALAVCAAVGGMLAAAGARAQISPQPSVRTLSGIVTDASHEPIRGAIVELHSEKSGEMVTYLTDSNGHYSFKRLDGNSDYDVRVMFRGRHSPTRSISKFDSHMNKVINFTLRTY